MTEKWGPGRGNGPQPNNPENPYPLKTWEDQMREKSEREAMPDDGPQDPYPPKDGCCAVCGEPADPSNAREYRVTGALAHVEKCKEIFLAAQQQHARELDEYRRRVDAERREKRRMELFRAAITARVNRLPHFRPCVGTDDFVRAVPHAKFRAFAEKYTIDRGSARLSGPSGSGKTTTLAAMIQRIAAELQPAKPVDLGYCEFGGGRQERYSLGCLESLVWTTGFDVAYARRNHALGSEPPLIGSAKSASLLVVDDVGSEPIADNVLFEIVNERYTRRLPTLITTGLTGEQFADRYGDALDRRLTEKGIGAPIEVSPAKKGNLNLVKP